MCDGHASVGPGVVAGDGGVIPPIHPYPVITVNTRRIAAPLHIHKQGSFKLGRGFVVFVVLVQGYS